jgi:hypothetical protein
MATEEPQIREKTSGPCVKQFSVFLLNRVGALLEIVRMLNDSDVHVLALNSQDSTDSALVRLVVSDPDAVESIFDLNEIAYSISDILVVEMREVAVDLRKLLQSLLMAEVNIQVCYPLLLRPHGRSALALHLDDPDCGCSVLEGEGFTILNQTDLSR